MVQLQKRYVSEKETIIEALDDIQSFINKMSIFMEAYPNYEYEIKIKKPQKTRTNVKWIIELNVLKHEHTKDRQGTKRLT